MDLQRTDWVNSVPILYKTKAKKCGKIKKILYDTVDYTNNKKIKKEAFVYLPFGYDESKKYNIFYLMHGWTGYAEEFFEKTCIINILDNMIENNEIESLIVVSATFDAENKSQDWERSINQLEPFHFDFENGLMPYIESHFSTYAETISKEDLIASRNHRAFGGFSLGGVITWWLFKYDLDYIKYFLPMSGEAGFFSDINGKFPHKETVGELELISRNSNQDYFITSYLGTRDVRADRVDPQMKEMLKRDTFKNNFVYYQSIGAFHVISATENYIYDGLKHFFSN